MKRSSIILILVSSLTSLLIACSNGGGSGSAAVGTSGTVNMTGTLDNSTVTTASTDTGLRRFLAFLSPIKKAFAADAIVTNIVAISPGGQVVTATLNGSNFSLNLSQGTPYIIVLLNGTTVVGLYKTDETTGMNSFPINENTTNINLGTVSLVGNVAQGTITSSTLLQDLGISQSVATAYGIMDIAMTRFSNVDIDGDGIPDYQENRFYNFVIDYEFNGVDSFVSIQGTWSNYADITYNGYEFYFFADPDVVSADWTNAMLNTPASVNGLNNQTQCYNTTSSSGRTLNFFCGGSAVSPATPPSGTYVVTAGSSIFTFQNVNSQTIDSSLHNLYMPQIMLTVVSGKVTNIAWQWWKKQSDGTWVQPSDAELSTVLSNAGYEIGEAGWNNRIDGSINLTSSGSTVPATQSFTPGAFRFSYNDKAGYAYGFTWL